MSTVHDDIAQALTGVVYFASETAGMGDRIKIGYTMNLRQRMRKLRCVPCVTVAGGPDLERYLHDYFADLRIDGEWFSLDGKLAQFLAVVKEQGIGDQARWVD